MTTTFRCGACSRTITMDDAAALWAATTKHREDRHPAQIWHRWDEQGLVDYMRSRRWGDE